MTILTPDITSLVMADLARRSVAVHVAGWSLTFHLADHDGLAGCDRLEELDRGTLEAVDASAPSDYWYSFRWLRLNPGRPRAYRIHVDSVYIVDLQAESVE